MTAPEAVQLVCPECGRDDSIEMSDGTRLCLSCRHEWDPTQAPAESPRVPAPPVLDTDDRLDTADILRATSIEDVLAPPMSAAELVAEHTGVQPADELPADLEGRFVVWTMDTNEPGLVIDQPRPGAVLVAKADGSEHEWPRVELRVLTDDEVREWGARGGAPGDDEPLVPVIATVASLVLTVGLEAVPDDDASPLLNPRIGWLPPPASDIPEVEQGAAYAVAILVRLFALDREAVAEVASNLMAGAAESANETETE